MNQQVAKTSYLPFLFFAQFNDFYAYIDEELIGVEVDNIKFSAKKRVLVCSLNYL